MERGENEMVNERIKECVEKVEKIFSKPLNNREIEQIAMWINEGITPEYVECAVSYSFNKKRCDLRYVEKVIITWSEKGIKTVADALQHIATLEKYKAFVDKLAQYTGDSFTFERHLQLAHKWFENYDFDLVKHACDICFERLNRFDAKYVDGILNSWGAQGFRMFIDVKDAESKERARDMLTLEVARHVGSALQDWELKVIHGWLERFDVECIKYACDICIDSLAQFRVKYVNAILSNWNTQNLKTIEEIKAANYSYEAKKRNATQRSFKCDAHKRTYETILNNMAEVDSRHMSMAYLLALDENIRGNDGRIAECFNFKKDIINPNVLSAMWVNEIDRRILNLAFNLWDSSHSASVSVVFADGVDMQYLFEAINIRFGPAK